MPFIDENPMRRPLVSPPNPEPQYVADDFFWTREALIAALEEGEKGEAIRNFSFEKFIAEMKARSRARKQN
jgi:hypothetical protein